MQGHSGSKPNIAAIIPARGGSKGIPGKNLADLGGKPLVAHSILAAKRCALIGRVFVSTDSQEIAEISRQWGAEVPCLRPPEMGRDSARVDEAVMHLLHTLKSTEGYAPEALVTLFPTHPFRSRWLMDELTSKLLVGYRCVQTVKAVTMCGFSHFAASGKRIALLSDDSGLGRRTFYRHYGLYTGVVFHTNFTRELYMHKVGTPAELVDIDEPGDLKQANIIARSWSPETVCSPSV